MKKMNKMKKMKTWKKWNNENNEKTQNKWKEMNNKWKEMKNEHKWKNNKLKGTRNEINHEWQQENTQLMIKVCEHWRPPWSYSKHELGSGDCAEKPLGTKWQNRSRLINVNKIISMWKMSLQIIQHDFWEPFSKHELHSGDWVETSRKNLPIPTQTIYMSNPSLVLFMC